MTKCYSWLMPVVVAGSTAFGSAAQASPNLVTNGGFETGTFSGWTETGETVFNGVQCPGAGPGVSEGSCGAYFGPVEAAGGIQQAINVGSTGLLWDLSFSFQSDGGAPSNFTVLFGGQTLLSLTSPAAGNTLYHFNGITTVPSMMLTFNFLDPVGFMFLDAVSVSAVPAVPAVPEPATTSLLAAGLAGLFFWRRRKTT